MSSSPTYLSRRYFRDLCDFVLDALDPEPTDPSKAIDLERIDDLPRHSLIYLSPKADTELFFRVVFPRIDTPVVLVTGGTGHPNPGRFTRHLDDRTSQGEAKIALWFCENKDREHTRIEPIPIGVREIFEEVIPELQEQAADLGPKTKLVCANFDPATASERVELGDHLATLPFVESIPYTPRATSAICRAVLPYKFAFAPPGKGIDTYRCFEILYSNVIPIVRRSPISPLFDDLPVLVIDDWKQITEAFLEEQYAVIAARFGGLEGRAGVDAVRAAPSLHMPFHVDRINRILSDRGIERPPVALDFGWLDSPERARFRRVFNGWYRYHPGRDPEVMYHPRERMSARLYTIKKLLYIAQPFWARRLPSRALLEWLYRFLYVEALPNGTSFSAGAYRVLQLVNHIVICRHESLRAALASPSELARAVEREDNGSLAPDWTIESRERRGELRAEDPGAPRS